MAISIRSMMQARSVREQALKQNLSNDGETPYTPFTIRELITPQYQAGALDRWDALTIAVTDATANRKNGRFDVNATVKVTDRGDAESFELNQVRVVFEDDSEGFLNAVRIGTVSTFGFERVVSISLREQPERIRIEVGSVEIEQPVNQDNSEAGIVYLQGAVRQQDGGYEQGPLFQGVTEQSRVEVDSSRDTWENWVGQHSEERTEYVPQSRQQLIAAVGEMAHNDGQIRAVGSGHSHSNAPEAPEHYIDLNPAGPKEDTDEALNQTLSHNGWAREVDHNGWLKDDDTLQQLYSNRDHKNRETHPFDADHLKRVEAGVVLRRLNRHILHENGYALKNMGSFDGQTVAGAINTSTHGTGVKLSSFADSVESVEIATVPESASGDPIVRLYRIEPSDGITDREKFEAATANHEMELIQNDDIFYSTVVGYGCMGVAYAYTIHVRDSYWLREETELMAWSDLTSALENSSNEVTEESVERFLTPDDCRHTQILVNIAADQVPTSALITHEAHGIGSHETENDPLCLVKRHFKVPPSNVPDKPDWWDNPADHIGDKRWPPERTPKTAKYIGKDLKIHLLKDNLNIPKILHLGFFHSSANNAPFFEDFKKSAWYVALRRLRDGGNKVSEYYNPDPPEPPAPTVEVGVALGDIVDAVNEARDRLQTIKQGDEIQGKVYDGKGKDVFFPSPMGLRFTAASKHYLSPEYRYDDDGTPIKTAMLEVPLPIYDVGSGEGVPALTFDENREWVVEPALSKLHNHLVLTGDSNIDFDARPHMGKHNEIDDGWLRANYEHYASNEDDEIAWLDVYNRFNAFGTFNNAFTNQLGIDN